MLSGPKRFRIYDLIDRPLGLFLLVLTSPLALLGIAVGRWSTQSSGIFRQIRVGKNGRHFTIFKIQTMRTNTESNTVTRQDDPRITRGGAWLRRWKIDELPQLVNVVRGEMTLVGPRPDVPGYADTLTGEWATVLDVKPGITGPATAFFRDEERVLSEVEDPLEFNDTVIFPLKARINRAWIENGTLGDDLRLLYMTIRTPDNFARLRAMYEKWSLDLPQSLDAAYLLRRDQNA